MKNQCIECKSCIFPKEASTGLNGVCTNTKQSKGVVALNFTCEEFKKKLCSN